MISDSEFASIMKMVRVMDVKLKALALEMISASDARVDALWSVPTRDRQFVNLNANITPKYILSQEAKSIAADVMTDIWLRPGQNARETVRAPGLIAVGEGLLNGFVSIQSEKIELLNALKGWGDADKRRLWKGFPGISSLQLLRWFKVLQSPEKIRYYWQQGLSVTKKPCHEVCSELKSKLFGARESNYKLEMSSETKALMRLELNALKAFNPLEVIIRCRITKPSIRARINDGGNVFITNASIPFLYDLSADIPIITPLESYRTDIPCPVDGYRDSDHPRKMLERHPIAKGSLLFRLKPPFRVLSHR
jgi:hypothetical protein